MDYVDLYRSEYARHETTKELLEKTRTRLQELEAKMLVAPSPDITVHALAMQEWRQRALISLRVFSFASDERDALRDEVTRLTAELETMSEDVPLHEYLGISEDDLYLLRALSNDDSRDWPAGTAALRRMFIHLDGDR